MSIGFLEAGTGRKSTDPVSGSQVDISLQSVLSKYDTIKTDVSRLVDNARYNTFEITGKQHYNTYSNDTLNGWAENWYAEYRAVLGLRADALQKKLQSAYNRVLEKSTYAEMAPNAESVFAPYANRTFSYADTTYKTPVSQALLRDVDVAAPPAAFTNPPPTTSPPYDWQAQVMDATLAGYNAADKTNPTQNPWLILPPNDGTPGKVYNQAQLGQFQREAVRNAINDTIVQNSMTDPNEIKAMVKMVINQANQTLGTSGGATVTPAQVLPYGKGIMNLENPPSEPQITTYHERMLTSATKSSATVHFLDGNVSGFIPTTAEVGGTPHTYMWRDPILGIQSITTGAARLPINVVNGVTNYIAMQGNVGGQTIPARTSYDLYAAVTGGVPTTSFDNDTYVLMGAATGTQPSKTSLTLGGRLSASDYVVNGADRAVAVAIPAGASAYFYDGTGMNYAAGGTNAVTVQRYNLYPVDQLGAGNPAAPNDPGGPGTAPDSTSTASSAEWYINNNPAFGINYWNVGSEHPAGAITGMAITPGLADPGWNNISVSDGMYAQLRRTSQIYYNAISGQSGLPTPAPSGPGFTPPTTGEGFWQGYAPDAAGTEGSLKISVPMFGGGSAANGSTQIDIKDYVSPEVWDTLSANPTAAAAAAAAIAETNNQIRNLFVGRQYNDITGGNDYDDDHNVTSVAIVPHPIPYMTSSTSPVKTVVQNINNQSINYLGASIAFAGSASIFPSIDITIPLNAGIISGDIRLLTFIGPDIFRGHMSAIGDGDPLLAFPNIGMGSITVDINITLTIPTPFGPIIIPIGLGITVNQSYDIATDIVRKFMDGVKKLAVETIQTQAYSASSGIAMDSYASRAEHHFTEPGFSEAMKALKFNILGIDFDFGETFNDLLFDGGDFLGPLITGNAKDTQVNKYTIRERLMDYKTSVQGAESRETDTGAFFSTNAFLSQFEMGDMEYQYWTGTQQNEEVVNTDLLRALSSTGKEFYRLIMSAIKLGSSSNGGAAGLLGGVLSMVLNSAAEAKMAEIFWNLFYKDQNLEGFINPIAGFGSESWFKGEGYNYIESDHKPFEGDSDFNYPPQNSPFSFIGDLFDKGTPDFVLEGYANTRRFRKGTANQAVVAENVTMSDYNNGGNTTTQDGFGPRGLAGSGVQNGALYGDNYGEQGDIGFWNDTALGDINEVYVGTRTVKFSNLTTGFNEFTTADVTTGAGVVTDTGLTGDSNITGSLGATRQVLTDADRYTGSDSRAYNKRYEGGGDVNMETFNTGLYSNKYGGVRGHYDRRNQYSLKFDPAKDTGGAITMFASQALNPAFGGFIKMAEIEKNKWDNLLQEHETNGMTGVRALGANANYQNFGAATDNSLNELNKTLYEHLHLREDGRNLSIIREYRDVFDTGLMKNVFISGQTYHPSGGGINSSIEIRYNPFGGANAVQADTRDNFDGNGVAGINPYFDPYNQTTLRKTAGSASIYLNNYIANKKRAGNKKT